jgi:hypothetical protein
LVLALVAVSTARAGTRSADFGPAAAAVADPASQPGLDAAAVAVPLALSTAIDLESVDQPVAEPPVALPVPTVAAPPTPPAAAASQAAARVLPAATAIPATPRPTAAPPLPTAAPAAVTGASCPATWFCYPRLALAGPILPYADCSGSTDVGAAIRSFTCLSDHYLMGHAYTSFGLIRQWVAGDTVYAYGKSFTVSGAITQSACAAPQFPLAALSMQTSLTSRVCGDVMVLQAR